MGLGLGLGLGLVLDIGVGVGLRGRGRFWLGPGTQLDPVLAFSVQPDRVIYRTCTDIAMWEYITIVHRI